MKRRNFIIGASAAASLVGCGSKALQSKQGFDKTYNWKLALAVNKTLPIWGDGIRRFAKLVQTMSNNQLKIKVFGAGEIIPTLEIFDAVKKGTVEMGHAAAYYWQGKIPAAVFFTAIPFGMNAQGMYAWITGGGGQKLWDELYAPYGVKAIPLGNTGMQMAGWFRQEIKNLADLKGLKIRMPGLGGKVLKRVGASAVNLAASEIFTSLSTGVIDATEWVGPYHDYVMGFYKVAKYYYSIGWHEPGSILELSINKKAWDELPAQLQHIVQAAAAQIDRQMYAEWMAKDAEYYHKILSNKNIKIRQLPKEIIAVFKKEAKVVVNEVRASSGIAQKVHDAFYQFKKKFDTYQNINERAYLNL